MTALAERSADGTETGPTTGAGLVRGGARVSRSDASLAAWVKQEFEKADRERSRLKRQWYLNIQMVRGNQNVEFKRTPASSSGFQLAVPPAPPWRVRMVINRIRATIRKEQSKLTAQRPNFVVVPATPSDEDHAHARLAEQLLDARYADLKIPAALRLWVWWATVTGTAFIKDYWDPSRGPLQADPLAPAVEKKAAGDSCVHVVDPFHLLVPDLIEPTLEGQPWVMHAGTFTPEYVKRFYGVEAPATTRATDLFTEDALTGGTSTPRSQVLVLECWLSPGAREDFPQGGLVTVVGDRVLVKRDNSKDGPVFQHGEVPFTKLEIIPNGSFYGESSITDLVPLQRLYNRQRSQIVESANQMGRPKWIAPVGSINAAQIDAEPGQVITYQPVGPAPTPVQPVPLPEYVQRGPDLVLRDMDDLSGQHEISRGQQPGQVTAATAISYLQEQDDTLLSWAIASLEEGMARLGGHLLSHVAQFWGQPRLVQYAGEDGVFDAITFSGKMIKGDVDVRVQAGSALPTSKAAKQATVLELYKLGAFGAPGSPEATTKLLEALDMSGMEKALDEWRVDQREALRENVQLAQGMQVPVQPWQNHAAHITLHNRFRKGQQFQMMPPEIQQLFAMHVQGHEEANFAQQAVAQMTGGESPGGSAPGEGPPDPSGGEGPGAPGGPGGADLGTLGGGGGPVPPGPGGP